MVTLQSVELLGQSPLLQVTPVLVAPIGLVSQSAPPLEGAGLVHILVWVMVPSPHVLEQVPFVHSDQPPFTCV